MKKFWVWQAGLVAGGIFCMWVSFAQRHHPIWVAVLFLGFEAVAVIAMVRNDL
jgi:hypothetical protein